MSLIITVHTHSGIIMASDSRITRTTTTDPVNGVIEKQIGVQITDTTYKTFICGKAIGLSFCGDSLINNTPITCYIEKYISENIKIDDNIENIAENILNYFSSIDSKLDIQFIVAGYNKSDPLPRVNVVYVNSKRIEVIETRNAGITWCGEQDILKRIVLDVSLNNEDGTYTNLQSYVIPYNSFTLQDAINFAEFAIDVTTRTMAFQQRVKTVGGPIDILAIKPDGAFWINRKELHAQGGNKPHLIRIPISDLQDKLKELNPLNK